MRKLIVLSLLAGCTSSRTVDLPRPAPDTTAAEVYFNSPPWAYRLGPELFATAGSDSAQVRAQLMRAGTAMGCHAVVSVTIPVSTRNARPWGFCAWRVEPVKSSR